LPEILVPYSWLIDDPTLFRFPPQLCAVRIVPFLFSFCPCRDFTPPMRVSWFISFFFSPPWVTVSVQTFCGFFLPSGIFSHQDCVDGAGFLPSSLSDLGFFFVVPLFDEFRCSLESWWRGPLVFFNESVSPLRRFPWGGGGTIFLSRSSSSIGLLAAAALGVGVLFFVARIPGCLLRCSSRFSFLFSRFPAEDLRRPLGIWRNQGRLFFFFFRSHNRMPEDVLPPLFLPILNFSEPFLLILFFPFGLCLWQGVPDEGLVFLLLLERLDF